MRRSDVQSPFPRATTAGEAAAPIQGRKDSRKPEDEADHFFPPPAHGRCSQTCEAGIWNRRNADGCELRVALPATRTGLPPCKAAWFAKSERPPRFSDGREGPGTLPESGCRWIGCAHLRGNAVGGRREDNRQ